MDNRGLSGSPVEVGRFSHSLRRVLAPTIPRSVVVSQLTFQTIKAVRPGLFLLADSHGPLGGRVGPQGLITYLEHHPRTPIRGDRI